MNLYKIVTITHVVAGTIGLITGLVAMIAKKGTVGHSKSGLIYYYSMMISSILAILMTNIHPNPFLLVIGIFSLYMIMTAKFAIEHWQSKTDLLAGTFKKSLSIVAFVTALVMVAMALYFLYNSNSIGLIFFVFSILLGWMAVEDWIWYSKKESSIKKNKKWLMMHLGRMGGSYIAASTAFLVNNITLQPEFIVWLGPTLVGTILIIKASQKWSNKLNL